MIRTPIETDDGVFVAAFSPRGLASLDFPGGATSAADFRNVGCPVPSEIGRWMEQTESALAAVLAAHKPEAMPPFDWDGATDFQQLVWSELIRIPSGTVRSYSEVAERIGKPRAIRAVGTACGANPIPVLVPCHRVCTADGSLGGFSGGLHWKELLLSRERAQLCSDPALIFMKAK